MRTLLLPHTTARLHLSLALSAAALGLGSCGGSGDQVDTSAADLPFCEKVMDANTQEGAEGGGNGASGYVFGRLLTDVTEDLHDPQFVAFVEYALENTDVGGAQRQGESDQEGTFTEYLGEGNWHIRISAFKGGYHCNTEMDFTVAAGDTTNLCIDMQCE